MKELMKCVFGSHMYGLNTPESDMDYKGIFIPTPESILAQKAPRNVSHSTGDDFSKNTSDDVDTEMFSLHEFINLACKGETVAIDMLHCPDDMLVGDSDLWQYIRENRSKFYTTNMSAYMGYVRKQAAKYGVKGSRMACIAEIIEELKTTLESCWVDHSNVRVEDMVSMLPSNDHCGLKVMQDKKGNEVPFYCVMEKKFQMSLRVTELIQILEKIYDTYGARAKMAMENEGVDWKAVSHAIRAGEQILEIYKTGDLVYPLKNRDFILDVKLGKLDFNTVVKPRLEELVHEVETLAADIEAKGLLPKVVDRKMWDELIELEYGNEVQTMMKKKYRSY